MRPYPRAAITRFQSLFESGRTCAGYSVLPPSDRPKKMAMFCFNEVFANIATLFVSFD
jgi:hypothetical protein